MDTRKQFISVIKKRTHTHTQKQKKTNNTHKHTNIHHIISETLSKFENYASCLNYQPAVGNSGSFWLNDTVGFLISRITRKFYCM